MPTTSQPVTDTEQRLWGALPPGRLDLGELIGTGPSPRVPFGQAGHLRDEVTGRGLERRNAAVRAVLTAPPRLQQVDPRGLLATQGGLDREGVRFYLGRSYREQGLTYADHDSVGNADPVILRRARGGARLILAGHHRATAALLRGRPLLARVVAESDAARPEPAAARQVTPLLTFDRPPPSEHLEAQSPDAAAGAVRADTATHVPDAATATVVLLLLGAGEARAARRVHYALTGRFS